MAINQTELTTLYKEHVNEVYRFAMYRIQDVETAKDITSETFLRCIRKVDKLSEVESKKAWLLGIARNILYETYRDQKQVSNPDTESQEFPDIEIETQEVTEELVELTKTKITLLDEISQEIIVLRVWEELPFSEVAEIVGLKESATKLRFYRGVEKLKELVEQDEPKVSRNSMPLLLGAVALLSNETVYTPAVGFTNSLLNLLNTQIMSAAVASGVGVAAGAAASTGAATGGTTGIVATLQTAFAPVMTQAFAIKGIAAAAASAAVVGTVAVTSTGAVTDNIYNQPQPQVVIEEPIKTPNVILEESEDGEIVINTSDWVRYQNDQYGVSFLHPKDMEVEVVSPQGLMEMMVEINAGYTSIHIGDSKSLVEYYDSQKPKTESNLGTILINNRPVEFKSFLFGEGFPSDFDENGEPICYEDFQAITNYALVDKYIVSFLEESSTTDCNDSGEKVTTGTSETDMAIGIEIIKSLQLIGYDEFQSWKLVQDARVGVETKVPTGFTLGRGMSDRSLSGITVSTPKLSLTQDDWNTVFSFNRATEKHKLTYVAHLDTVEGNDRVLDTLKFNGKNLDFKYLEQYGIEDAFGDGCEGDEIFVSREYYTQLTAKVQLTLTFGDYQECSATLDGVRSLVVAGVEQNREIIQKILDNTRVVQPTAKFDPYDEDSKFYNGDQISFWYPAEWEIQKSDAGPNSSKDSLVVRSQGEIEMAIGYDGEWPVGFGPSAAKNRPAFIYFNDQVVEDEETWFFDCNYPDDCEVPSAFKFTQEYLRSTGALEKVTNVFMMFSPQNMKLIDSQGRTRTLEIRIFFTVNGSRSNSYDQLLDIQSNALNLIQSIKKK